MVQKNSIVVIVGPTAVGKTSLSIKLAKKFNGEIISADSVQVYKRLNIGSAKVTKAEMGGVKHHLIDILDFDKPFSASDFALLASKAIEDIAGRNKLPIIVGGTGLYVNSLLFPLSVDCGSDPDFRKLCEKENSLSLYEKLKKVDPESAKLIHPNHKTRIIRALEIYHLTGKKKSDFQKSESQYNYLLIGLTMDREKLYERINSRVDQMLENGLVDEVRALMKDGFSVNCQSSAAIGYKECIEYLNNKTSYQDFVAKLKQNSRNYAKRQLTYFKKMQNIVMIENDEEKIFKMVEDFYGKK